MRSMTSAASPEYINKIYHETCHLRQDHEPRLSNGTLGSHLGNFSCMEMRGGDGSTSEIQMMLRVVELGRAGRNNN